MPEIADLPQDFIDEYEIQNKETKYGYVYLEIRKGVYGLPQAGILVQKLIDKRLNVKGYRQSDICPDFWKHDWRLICFSLCVDDWG